MRGADHAWLALGAGVITYESLCGTDELLSIGVDRYLEAHPWITRAVIGLTALHLCNALPVWADPWSGVWWLRQLTKGARHGLS